MEKNKLCAFSPEEVKMISEAESKLSAKCGQNVALVAYSAD